MSNMENPLKSPNPRADGAMKPIPNRHLKRISDLFGFGLLEPKVFWYALGTLICGLGAGLSIDALWRTRHAPADWLAWSGIALMMLGNVIGNMAHSFLKKDARRKLEIDATRHDEAAS